MIERYGRKEMALDCADCIYDRRGGMAGES